jgi:Icc-related predicted phosphoesterase
MLLKFVAISDTHCRHKSVSLPKGDVLLHAGDISYKGSYSEVADFLHWFAALPFAHKVFIAGNHDFYFERVKEAAIQKLIPEGVTYLNDSGIVINGIRIWGSPVTPWFYNWAFNRYRGAAISKHWALVPADTNLLVTHGPAFGVLDAVLNGNNTGDKDLLKTIEAIKPAVHLCGHIHEAYGQLKRGGTKFINASVLNEKYELVNPPVVFEL